MTALEVWLVACLVFVFLALIEYGVVLRVMSTTKEKALEIEDEVKVKKKHKTLIRTLQVWQSKTRGGSSEINVSTEESLANTANNTATNSVVGQQATEEINEMEDAALRKGQRLDKIALVILPLIYIIFNIMYWVKYIYLP